MQLVSKPRRNDAFAGQVRVQAVWPGKLPEPRSVTAATSFLRKIQRSARPAGRLPKNN